MRTGRQKQGKDSGPVPGKITRRSALAQEGQKAEALEPAQDLKRLGVDVRVCGRQGTASIMRGLSLPASDKAACGLDHGD